MILSWTFNPSLNKGISELNGYAGLLCAVLEAVTADRGKLGNVRERGIEISLRDVTQIPSTLPVH